MSLGVGNASLYLSVRAKLLGKSHLLKLFVMSFWRQLSIAYHGIGWSWRVTLPTASPASFSSRWHQLCQPFEEMYRSRETSFAVGKLWMAP